MPVWTYKELDTCRQHIFLKLLDESLTYVYNMLGGVPRYCLEVPTEVLLQGDTEEMAHNAAIARLEDVIAEVKNPLKVLCAQREGSNFVKISGRLFHKVPTQGTYLDEGY